MLSDSPVNLIYNEAFLLAEEFIYQTSRNIFVTGKAGTGKTTFLKKIKAGTIKNTVVVAPTGVAAINAGGVTIHSFFQLPFAPFIPTTLSRVGDGVGDVPGLLRNLRIENQKRNIIRELQLLIIDEVSMVRSDVLDAIDTILRYLRKNDYPFGGVQVLLIGDLFQLPPVVPANEWSILNQYYESPFFFDAHAIRQSPPVYLELKEIYRQRDQGFIDVLNKVRNNEMAPEDFNFLNARYNPDFKPSAADPYIILTTHNSIADRINTNALNALKGDAFYFEGEVEGDFSERSFPTDKSLKLKVGAQVMVIKNDLEKIKRYYNGKIGTVTKIDNESISIKFKDEEHPVAIEKDTWHNVKYTVSATHYQVEEEVIGTFTQFPIRLAWAVTIHKSQGLTFDKVIIDAGNSFAAGQVYVALSRCTSIEGIILYAKISPMAITTDPRVLKFSQVECSLEELKPVLAFERQKQIVMTLLRIFDFTNLISAVDYFNTAKGKKKSGKHAEAKELIQSISVLLETQHSIALKFQNQIQQLLHNRDFDNLAARILSGVDYFKAMLDDKVIMPLQAYDVELSKLKKVRQHRKRISELIQVMTTYKDILSKAITMCSQLDQGKNDRAIMQ